MDATSPGNMPVSLGEVWVGNTACNSTAFERSPLAGAVARAPQNCIIDWPPQPWASPTVLPLGPAPRSPATWYTAGPWNPVTIIAGAVPPPRLSDEDVDRIAKRVVELLRGER